MDWEMASFDILRNEELEPVENPLQYLEVRQTTQLLFAPASLPVICPSMPSDST